MNISSLRSRLGGRSSWIALVVAVYGLLVIVSTLVRQLGIRRFPTQLHGIDIVVDLPLLFGVVLLYVSLLLRRRKRNAWAFAVAVYIFLLGLNTNSLLLERFGGLRFRAEALGVDDFISILAPGLILLVLVLAHKDFVVRSDIRTFTTSVKIAVLVLAVTFIYGTAGFLLMDRRDFHQEISLPTAMHYTVDQFDLTTNPLQPYTKRAKIFSDSLTFISVSAVGAVLISLFQPLRSRYVHHKEQAELAHRLIYEGKADSEDFFKLWPQDKTYLFNRDNQAGLAYKVRQGVALVVGDPFGQSKKALKLLGQFEDLCFVNDWRPAFIHTTPVWSKQYKERGYQLQLIGKEAVVDLDHFEKTVAQGKYFRQINNRFSKHGFTTELLQPSHHAAIVDRLKSISDEWLSKPGRAERRFMMGYFSEPYMQLCSVFVVRDAAGTIQAFLNLLPSPVPEEADFDMLRSSNRAQGNINDYLLMQLISYLRAQGFERLNMGLCPLVGLDQEPSTLINRTLRFVYSNGDRFYSFQGLYKFKAKYEPTWSERYVVYKGGARDFTRVMSALTGAMKV